MLIAMYFGEYPIYLFSSRCVLKIYLSILFIIKLIHIKTEAKVQLNLDRFLDRLDTLRSTLLLA